MASSNPNRKPVPPYIPPQPIGRRVSMNSGTYETGGSVPWGQSRRVDSPYNQPPAYQSSDSVQRIEGYEEEYAAEPAVISTAPLLLSVSTRWLPVGLIANEDIVGSQPTLEFRSNRRCLIPYPIPAARTNTSPTTRPQLPRPLPIPPGTKLHQHPTNNTTRSASHGNQQALRRTPIRVLGPRGTRSRTSLARSEYPWERDAQTTSDALPVSHPDAG